MVNKDNIQHVHPLKDDLPHLLSCEFREGALPRCACDCKPFYFLVGDGMIVVHNAFDGREGTEWANEILNQINKPK